MTLILLLSDDGARGRAALSLALAESALGRPATLFAQERAVALLAAAPRADDETEALAAAGLPDRRALLAMAVESGVSLIACQTGLALTGLTLPDLVPGVEAGGLMGLAATLGEARWLTV
ncbi:DsrE family protein [Sphingomonas sp.]|uniref:DsrE family protein n=1 Tax=Sphingomonas sp. TaxID=28214 RepID=UPI0025EAC682|nr:DsrE family protein [Sphingomonas sp.]